MLTFGVLVMQMRRAPEVHTVDEKLQEIRKWAMRHRTKTAPAAPTGIMAYLPAVFSAPEPEPESIPISPITEGKPFESVLYPVISLFSFQLELVSYTTWDHETHMLNDCRGR
jgi:hypothetical protein